MVMKADQLAALQTVARIRSERELKKFSAFAQHMTQLRTQADAMRAALEQCYHSAAPLTVAEARMANAQAGRSARELQQVDRQLQQLEPKFQAARTIAVREFGRAEVLSALVRQGRKVPR